MGKNKLPDCHPSVFEPPLWLSIVAVCLHILLFIPAKIIDFFIYLVRRVRNNGPG